MASTRSSHYVASFSFLLAVFSGCPVVDDGQDFEQSSDDEHHLSDSGANDDGGVQEFSDSGEDSMLDQGGTSTDAGFVTVDPADSGTMADSGTTSTIDDTETCVVPTRYLSGQVYSPLTACVRDRYASVIGSADMQLDVFMKAGASGTVNTKAYHCLDNDDVDISFEPGLADGWSFFRDGDAEGVSPYRRHSLSTKVGRSAVWAVSGDPSPLQQEIDAISPHFVVVHYGANDMNMGSTIYSALRPFHGNMIKLIDASLDNGVLPIVAGIGPRQDSETHNGWVPIYNATMRALAQHYQVPFIELHIVMDALPNDGKSSDGLHLNSSPDGACAFDDANEYGYPARNLAMLRGLDRVHDILVDENTMVEASPPALAGQGTWQDPFVVDDAPIFVDNADTSTSTADQVDVYDECSDADESGPEVVYQVTVEQPSRLVGIVLDHSPVDVDIHLLSAEEEPQCLTRAHRKIDTDVESGDYLLSLDTWVDGDGDEKSGAFTLVLMVCPDDDDSCQYLVP